MTIARDLSKILDANGDLTIDTSTLFVDSSTNRVGIGTTSPQGAIGIRQSGYTSEMYFTTDAVSTPNDLQIYIGDGGPILKIDDGFVFRINHQSSERMRIDSSGNVLVGTTDSNPSNNTSGGDNGISFVNGQIRGAKSGNAPMDINRMDSDGDIAYFRKDGNTVGSIGVDSGDNLYLAGSSGGTKGIYFNGSAMQPANTGGAGIDNAVSIGNGTYRWQNLYLGGNIYLGGTGSANALDDYEEGTWTATSVYGTVNSQNTGYIKVGNKVTLWGRVNTFSDRSTVDTVYITGLPFTVDSSFDETAVGSCMQNYSNNPSEIVYLTSTNRLTFYSSKSSGFTVLGHNQLNSASANIYFVVTYRTT